MVVLNRENPEDKFFLVFDIRRNCFTRRIAKQTLDDEAFAIDCTGKTLAYIEGDSLHLRQCRLPNSAALNKVLRPRYSFDKESMTCAEQVENKLAFKDVIYRDMLFYHMFKADIRKAEKLSCMTEEQNTHLLVRKYEEAISNPWRLKANREFLML